MQLQHMHEERRSFPVNSDLYSHSSRNADCSVFMIDIRRRLASASYPGRLKRSRHIRSGTMRSSITFARGAGATSSGVAGDILESMLDPWRESTYRHCGSSSMMVLASSPVSGSSYLHIEGLCIILSIVTNPSFSLI